MFSQKPWLPHMVSLAHSSISERATREEAIRIYTTAAANAMQMNTTIMKTSVRESETLSNTSYLHSSVHHQYFFKSSSDLENCMLMISGCVTTAWRDTRVTGILATCKDGGVDSVQPSPLHSLRHFTGGWKRCQRVQLA